MVGFGPHGWVDTRSPSSAGYSPDTEAGQVGLPKFSLTDAQNLNWLN